ncbi:MAG: DedA family protein [Marmoricola sp.]
MIAPHLLILGIHWLDPDWLLQHFGTEFFWVSALMILVECGLFFPFLPGDTLLFAIGLFVATDKLVVVDGGRWTNLLLSLVVLGLAAFAGNVIGYEIGRLIGPPLAQRDGRILKKKYFDQTHAFFQDHGNQALVIGRFVPFVRTYVTVVAGIGEMDRRRFFTWSAVGAVLWMFIITMLGFSLGRTSIGHFLAKNIDIAILGITAISLIPVAIEWWRRKKHTPVEN